MSDPFIQITILIDHGSNRTEAQAREMQWKIVAYADKLGADNTFVEDTDGTEDVER